MASNDNDGATVGSKTSVSSKTSITAAGTVVTLPGPRHQLPNDQDFACYNKAGEPLFCVCRQVSSSQMVACDNPQCPYEWFHFPCVGLKGQPEGEFTNVCSLFVHETADHWFCQYCTASVLPQMPQTQCPAAYPFRQPAVAERSWPTVLPVDVAALEVKLAQERRQSVLDRLPLYQSTQQGNGWLAGTLFGRQLRARFQFWYGTSPIGRTAAEWNSVRRPALAQQQSTEFSIRTTLDDDVIFAENMQRLAEWAARPSPSAEFRRMTQHLERQLEAGPTRHCHWHLCRTEGGRELLLCARCRLVHYCSAECQRDDWKSGGHRFICPTLCAAMRLEGPPANGEPTLPGPDELKGTLPSGSDLSEETLAPGSAPRDDCKQTAGQRPMASEDNLVSDFDDEACEDKLPDSDSDDETSEKKLPTLNLLPEVAQPPGVPSEKMQDSLAEPNEAASTVSDLPSTPTFPAALARQSLGAWRRKAVAATRALHREKTAVKALTEQKMARLDAELTIAQTQRADAVQQHEAATRELDELKQSYRQLADKAKQATKLKDAHIDKLTRASQHQQAEHARHCADAKHEVQSLTARLAQTEAQLAKAQLEDQEHLDLLALVRTREDGWKRQLNHLSGRDLHELKSLEDLQALEDQLREAQAALASERQRRVKALEAERKRAGGVAQCPVCLEPAPNCALIPCGHLVCFDGCAPQLAQCPVCRSAIERKVRVFL